ncbi:MAG: hypothetical protein R3Y47_09665 [Lachnospiraceae bacterium]
MNIILCFKGIVLLSLIFGFVSLLHYVEKSRVIESSAKSLYATMQWSEYHRQRIKKESFFMRIEKRLLHSGLTKRVPFLSVEVYIVSLICLASACFIVCIMISKSLLFATIAFLTTILVIEGILQAIRIRNYKRIDKSLLEFVNLLGNYSISSGEIIHALYAVSKYMKEPLKSALEESYYEANTSGDIEEAIDHLMDKIPHPKFIEFMRNLKICTKYSADYSILIQSTRRSLQDYSKSCKERYSMMQEGLINMGILIIMLFVMMISVDQMIEGAVMEIMLYTTVGNIAIGVVLVVIALFARKMITVEQE